MTCFMSFFFLKLNYENNGNRAKLSAIEDWTPKNIPKAKLEKIDVVSLISR